MRIWAHRGCSQNYPENTMTAFRKAIELDGLTGIELDIQLSQDGRLMVFHDETLDRTTNGTGNLRDYTCEELKRLVIDEGNFNEQIPTMEEVLDLLADRIEKDRNRYDEKTFEEKKFMLNIELKNSVFAYPGMEEKIVTLVHERKMEEHIVYSTFYAKSLEKLYALNPKARLAILDVKTSDCIYKIKGGCKAVDIHPFWRGIDESKENLQGYVVRAWMSGHLYPEKPTGTKLDLRKLEEQGITDIILNEPEVYLT